jgi:hypothetical protein
VAADTGVHGEHATISHSRLLSGSGDERASVEMLLEES